MRKLETEKQQIPLPMDYGAEKRKEEEQKWELREK